MAKTSFSALRILNNDYQCAEWGYVSFSELKSIKINGWLEIDCEQEEHWKPKKAIEIEKIRIAQGWLLEGDNQMAPTGETELIREAS